MRRCVWLQNRQQEIEKGLISWESRGERDTKDLLSDGKYDNFHNFCVSLLFFNCGYIFRIICVLCVSREREVYFFFFV